MTPDSFDSFDVRCSSFVVPHARSPPPVCLLVLYHNASPGPSALNNLGVRRQQRCMAPVALAPFARGGLRLASGNPLISAYTASLVLATAISTVVVARGGPVLASLSSATAE